MNRLSLSNLLERWANLNGFLRDELLPSERRRFNEWIRLAGD